MRKYNKLTYETAEKARRGSLGLWKARRGVELAEEAIRCRPDASTALRAHSNQELVASLMELLQPSDVAAWMMLTQVRTVQSIFEMGDLLGIAESKVYAALDGRHKLSLSAKRATWFIWSLLFCPEQLKDMFHIRTYGAFLDPLPDLEVKRFEADRILKGYARAEFSELLTEDTCTSLEEGLIKGGAVHYFVGSGAYPSEVVPRVGLVRSPCTTYCIKDWPGIFDAHDSGLPPSDIGKMFNVASDYIVKTNLFRVKYQLMLMPVVLTEVDLTDEDLAEIRRVAS